MLLLGISSTCISNDFCFYAFISIARAYSVPSVTIMSQNFPIKTLFRSFLIFEAFINIGKILFQPSFDLKKIVERNL